MFAQTAGVAARPISMHFGQRHHLNTVRRYAFVAAPLVRPRATTSARAPAGGDSSNITDRVNQFLKEHKVAERLQAAAEELQERAASTAQRLDREYDLRGRAAAARDAVQQKAAEMESKMGIRTKLQLWAKDFARTWPGRRKQLMAFLNTTLGQACALLLLLLLLQTGLFWRLLSWLLLFSWLTPMILMPLLARKAAEDKARRAANPFAGVEDLFSSFRSQQASSRGGGSGNGRGSNRADQTIDVSFEVLDD